MKQIPLLRPYTSRLLLLPLIALLTMLLLVLAISALRDERATIAIRIIEQQQRLEQLADQVESAITDRIQQIERAAQREVASSLRDAAGNPPCAAAFGCSGISGDLIEAVAAYRADGQRLQTQASSSLNFGSEFLPLDAHANNIKKTLSSFNADNGAGWVDPLPGRNSRPYCWREDNGPDFCVLVRMGRLISAVLTPAIETVPWPEDAIINVVGAQAAELLPAKSSEPFRVPHVEKMLPSPFKDFRIQVSQASGFHATSNTIFYFVSAALLAALATGFTAAAYWLHRRSVSSVETRMLSIANVSHSLRTPLTNLKLYAELIERNADSARTVRGYAEIIIAEAGRLAAVIENVLEIGRAGEGYRPTKRVAVPDEIVRSILESFRMAQADASNNDNFNVGDPLLMDVDGFEQILNNIIDNAQKYAPGSSLDITTRFDGSFVYLVLRDYGPGPGDDGDDTSAAYRRRAGSVARGFGLGLAACGQIAAQNNGTLKVESAMPGCRVTVTLAATPAQG